MLCFAGLSDMGRVQTAAEMTRAGSGCSQLRASPLPGSGFGSGMSKQGHLSASSSSSSSSVSYAPRALAPSREECTDKCTLMVGWLSQFQEITKTKLTAGVIGGSKPYFLRVLTCSVRILKIFCDSILSGNHRAGLHLWKRQDVFLRLLQRLNVKIIMENYRRRWQVDEFQTLPLSK